MTDKLSTTARLRALDVMHGEIARATLTEPNFTGAPTWQGKPINLAELIIAARELIEVFDNPRRQNVGEEIERLRRALP